MIKKLPREAEKEKENRSKKESSHSGESLRMKNATPEMEILVKSNKNRDSSRPFGNGSLSSETSLEKTAKKMNNWLLDNWKKLQDTGLEPYTPLIRKTIQETTKEIFEKLESFKCKYCNTIHTIRENQLLSESNETIHKDIDIEELKKEYGI